MVSPRALNKSINDALTMRSRLILDGSWEPMGKLHIYTQCSLFWVCLLGSNWAGEGLRSTQAVEVQVNFLRKPFLQVT